MPQLQLPIFPAGVTHLTSELAFMKREGQVTYFNGLMPVFTHAESDLRTFRMITSQFIINGNVKQSQVARVFGLPLVTVKRYTKLYREKGPAGFYSDRRRRGAAVLTPEVIEKAQAMFDEGLGLPEVSLHLGLLANTLSKAVHAGRLHQPLKKKKTRFAVGEA
jgi:transposase